MLNIPSRFADAMLHEHQSAASRADNVDRGPWLSSGNKGSTESRERAGHVCSLWQIAQP